MIAETKTMADMNPGDTCIILAEGRVVEVGKARGGVTAVPGRVPFQYKGNGVPGDVLDGVMDAANPTEPVAPVNYKAVPA